jgi:hypothetical protein
LLARFHDAVTVGRDVEASAPTVSDLADRCAKVYELVATACKVLRTVLGAVSRPVA